jgi:hypothetical protein
VYGYAVRLSFGDWRVDLEGEDRDLDALPHSPQVSEDRDPILGRMIASRSQLTM